MCPSIWMEKSLISALSDWLRKPSIEVRVAEAKELTELKEKCEKLQRDADRAMYMYSEEVSINLQLEDELRRRGIPHPLLKK